MYSKLTMIEDDEIRWFAEVEGEINSVIMNKLLLICGTHQGCVLFYSAKTGRLLLNRYVQLSKFPIIKVGLNEFNQTFAISNNGTLLVWELNYHCPFKSKNLYRCSISELMGRGKFIDAYFQGKEVVVSISDDCLYKYDQKMGSWICLKDHSYFGSGLKSLTYKKVSPLDIRMLNDVEKDIHTMAQIESELANALTNQNSEDFKMWSRTYVNHLISKKRGTEKLKEFCDEFLRGEVESDIEVYNQTWRRKLLESFLPLLATNRSLERLVKNYRQQITFREENIPIIF